MVEITKPTLVWFRRDLRLHDNPALSAALERGGPVIPVYLWCPREEGRWSPGGAQRWWLHEALKRFSSELERRGLRLILGKGDNSKTLIKQLIESTGADSVYWNRCYEPPVIKRDSAIKRSLREAGIRVGSFNGNLLFEPWKVGTNDGNAYKVYTPFWKKVKDRPIPRPLESDLARLGNSAPETWPDSVPLEALRLLPRTPWYEKMGRIWTPSEKSAHMRLRQFLKNAIREYEVRRDFPGVSGTSSLSPYLHFGHISSRQIWWETEDRKENMTKGVEVFRKEIVWREFATHVLYHFPDTPEVPLRAEFLKFPWKEDATLLKRWKQGRTGYPLVDAGMRQLWEEGWMHNRVRMVVASFLVKHLLQPWQAGASWFWDTLVDADLANNTLGWQWAGGCGADAAPYFRIFNPIIQSEKFDPDGRYIRRYVPELRKLEASHIHTPWEAPEAALRAAGVVLGENYPKPVLSHESGRRRALDAFEKIKNRETRV